MQIISRDHPRQHSTGRSWVSGLALGVIAIGMLGCETFPTHIEGRRVIGTRYVEGKRVYLVEARRGDQTEVIEIAAESAKAAKGIVFKGTR